MTSTIEIPFKWTCPICGHFQSDTVNPDLGPYLSLTCGKCGQLSDEATLSEKDIEAWKVARVKAESIAQGVK